MNPLVQAERRRDALELLAWLVMTVALFMAAHWESERQARMRLQAFDGETADLAQICEIITAGRLRAFDDTLRTLREAYVAGPRQFEERVRWLRSGPLADPSLMIILVDRDGHLVYTDSPNARPGMYLGDRPYFRYFADGGKDVFYIDEPTFGRATKRYSVPLTRPMYDANGAFLGVVAISVLQDSLADFGSDFQTSGEMFVTVVTQRGAVMTRSYDLPKVQGTNIAAELLDRLLQGDRGAFVNPDGPGGVSASVAYRQVRGTSLRVYVTHARTQVLRSITWQRVILLSGAAVTSVLAFLLLVAAAQRRRIRNKFTATQHAYLREAQRIAGMGSWELKLGTGRFQCSDEIFRLFGVAREGSKTDLAHFLARVVESDRDGVHQAIEKAVVEGHGRIAFQITRGDGQVRHMVGSTEALRSPAGKVTALIGTVRDVTERRAAEAALALSESRYRTLARVVPVGIFRADEAGLYSYVNEHYAHLSGHSREAAMGEGWLDALHPQDRARVKALWAAFVRGDGPFSCELRLVGAEGSVRWVMVQAQAETNEDGRVLGFAGSVADITERKRVEAQLRIAATTFESQEGTVITDAQSVILQVNKAFTETTGYAPEEVIGKTPRILKSGRHTPAFYADMWERIVQTGKWQGEVWDRHKSGRIYPKWLTISAVRNTEGVVTHYVGTHTDITERKQAEEKIQQLAFFDSLTGLPNRSLLFDRLRQAMTSSARTGSHNALLFIDLDHFKNLNDTQGHDKGDLLLQLVAQRLTASVREGDSVARLGGDEFVVMLTGLGSTPGEAAAQTETIGAKLLATLDRSYRLGGSDYHCSASMGITLFSGQRVGIDDLLKQADLALYKAKDAGRNASRFFDPAMEAAVLERSALEIDLRQAVDQRQFLLHYQVQIAGENTPTGVEALVRWMHPRRQLVSPADFIPLAEDAGLILPLGLWVMETACAQLAAWAHRPEMAALTMAVNVSAKQFRDPGFVAQVLGVLQRTGANPCRLKIELTESLLVDSIEDTIEKMAALKAQGVGFSLDDFGTGYSSLAYLKRLPLDQLKIDRSFVRDVLTDSNDAAIARTIVALGQSLGLSVIAEGVESAAQRDLLADLGCHAFQGYYFSRPLPLDAFERYVLER